MKPLLAVTATLSDITYPVLASPKLDGIRCVIHDGKALSRSLKQIPNLHVQNALKDVPDGCDGELICGSFNETTSAIMRVGGTPAFEYHVFDYVSDEPYTTRLQRLQGLTLPDFCKIVPQTLIADRQSLNSYYQKSIDDGLEGIMIRSTDGRYKFGRSTLKERILLKLKPFADSEAIIVGFEELEHNNNEAQTNELGRTFRSSAQSGKVGGNTLGKIIVKGTESEHFGGIEFSIGTGFSAELRSEIWEGRNQYLGKLVKFKYQVVGSVDKPRIPVFLGFRHFSDT